MCSGWHTPGLDGREARYGRGTRTADGPQAPRKPLRKANSNRAPRFEIPVASRGGWEHQKPRNPALDYGFGAFGADRFRWAGMLAV